jgi:hypothetical protein
MVSDRLNRFAIAAGLMANAAQLVHDVPVLAAACAALAVLVLVEQPPGRLPSPPSSQPRPLRYAYAGMLPLQRAA